jgi:hypothetical protein
MDNLWGNIQVTACEHPLEGVPQFVIKRFQMTLCGSGIRQWLLGLHRTASECRCPVRGCTRPGDAQRVDAKVSPPPVLPPRLAGLAAASLLAKPFNWHSRPYR